MRRDVPESRITLLLEYLVKSSELVSKRNNSIYQYFYPETGIITALLLIFSGIQLQQRAELVLFSSSFIAKTGEFICPASYAKSKKLGGLLVFPIPTSPVIGYGYISLVQDRTHNIQVVIEMLVFCTLITQVPKFPKTIDPSPQTITYYIGVKVNVLEASELKPNPIYSVNGSHAVLLPVSIWNQKY